MKISKHNKEAYEALKKKLEASNRACSVCATGTGKSYQAYQFIGDNPDKKFLFITSYKANNGKTAAKKDVVRLFSECSESKSRRRIVWY